MVILTHISQNLTQVLNCLNDILWHVRFFAHLERLIVVAALIGEIAYIDQSVAQAALVADFTPNLQSLLEVGQSIFGIAERRLRRGHYVQAEGQTALLPDVAPDRERLLFVAQNFLRLAQIPVSYRHQVQAGGLLFLVVHLSSQTIG